MKKQKLSLFLMAILFIAFTTTSCSKKDDTTKEETEEPGDGDGTGGTTSASLKGSDYYLIALDATTEKKIASKIKGDFRTDDLNMFLYIWESTYSAGSSVGPNSFGEVEGWTSLVVNSVGWSGCGFSPASTKTIKLDALTDDYKLRFAMKSKDNATHQILLFDGTNTAKITIGASDFEGVAPYTNFTRDGEWHEIEIPVSVLKDKGLRYTSAGFNSGNLLAVLSGPVAGTKLDIDGIFFYKPAAK